MVNVTETRMLELQDELLAAISLEVGPIKQELEVIAGYLNLAADKHNGLTDMTCDMGESFSKSLARLARFINDISKHTGFDLKAWMDNEQRHGR